MSEEKKKLVPEAYNIRLPKNTLLKLRVREAENTKTKETQNPMHNLTLEVIESAPINNVDINGLDFYERAVLTEKALPFANKLRAAFGFHELKTIDDINRADARDFIGQVCFAICESSEEERVNELTKEKVLDPYTGKPMVTYRRRVVEWVPKPVGH